MIARTEVLGIDIGDDALRVAGLRKVLSGYIVTRIACYPWDDERTPAEAGTLLAGLRHETGPARAAIALPASGCSLKTASLPPGKPVDLARIARFEAENQFPLPLRDLVWGYTLTPEASSGRQHAVIAGARRLLVDERLALLKQAGMTPAVLLPTPLAAAGAVSHPNGRYLLVVAGTQWSDLCLYDDQRLLGCRSVLAGNPLAAGWTERIAREIQPWIGGGENPERIVLAGAVTGKTAGMLADLSELPVDLGDPWQDIRNAREVQADMPDSPLAYAAAIGLARAALGGRGMNLLPAELLEERVKQRKFAWSLAGLAVLAALLVPVVMSGQQTLQQRQAGLQQMRAQVQQVRKTAGPAPDTGMATAQQLLTALSQSEGEPLDVLWALSTALPKEMTLSDLTYNRGKAVIIKGRADTNARLAAALASINGLAVFERVILDYSTASREEGTQGYDFQMTCILPAISDPTLGTGRNTTAQPGKRTVIQ